MDLATIIGLIGGAACIVMSVLTSGGTMGGIIDPPSIFMTIGGSWMALFICAPINKVLPLWRSQSGADPWPVCILLPKSDLRPEPALPPAQKRLLAAPSVQTSHRR